MSEDAREEHEQGSHLPGAVQRALLRHAAVRRVAALLALAAGGLHGLQPRHDPADAAGAAVALGGGGADAKQGERGGAAHLAAPAATTGIHSRAHTASDTRYGAPPPACSVRELAENHARRENRN